MEYRSLGRTGLRVSVMGFGTGGPGLFGEHIGLSAEQRRALVRRAFDLGINVFDTAQGYGESEPRLADALQGLPRDEYVLSTKWDHAEWKSPRGVGGQDGPVKQDPNGLVEGVETSLRQLQTDRIDVFFLHGVRPEQYDEVVDRFGPVGERLRERGKIRCFGLSERYIVDPKHEAIVRGLTDHPQLWDVVMLKYGILNQWAAREAIPLAEANGVGVMNMAAVRIKLPDPAKLAQLIADWKDGGLLPPDSLPDTNPLGFLVHDGVPSVVAAAYKFGIDHPGVSTLLTGTTSIDHLEDNVAAIGPPMLPEADKQRVADLFGHIAEYV